MRADKSIKRVSDLPNGKVSNWFFTLEFDLTW